MSYKLLPKLVALIIWSSQIFATSAHANPADLLPRFLVGCLWNTTILGQRLFFLLGPLGHAVNFGVLALLLAWAISDNPILSPVKFRLALSGACLYALSDEVHQIFVPTRTFQVRDLIVDALGALLGLYLFQWLKVLRTRKAESQSPLL